MSTKSLEDDLLIWSWGQWARDRIERELGCGEAPWAYLMDTASAYDESPRNPIPSAPGEWCERIDKMIAAMGPDAVYVMTSLYSIRVGVNALSRHRPKHHPQMSKRQIIQSRDACLNQLHGAMFLRHTG